MKYGFFPKVMWFIFSGSFTKQLYIMNVDNKKAVMKKAKTSYQKILAEIPEFDNDDRFFKNILSAAMLAAVYLNLEEKPSLDDITTYYHKAMNENIVTSFFVKKQNNYSKEAQERMAQQAKDSQGKNNPYTWKFRYEAGTDINSYNMYFDSCGICYLFKKLGIAEITPAMCTYDYDIAKLGGSVLTRQHTLAKDELPCDFHYQKNINQ